MKSRQLAIAVIGIAASVAWAPTCSAAQTQEAISFAGRTVTMIVGFAVGGGADTNARAVARFYSRLLPGAPSVVVRNVPGAQGLTALNYFVKQAEPDGLTVNVGSTSQLDPLNYRRPQALYKPMDLVLVGGIGVRSTALLINKQALTRIHDQAAPPVTMGSVGAGPRSGMQITAWGIEYFGWNARWVVGYRGTQEVNLALTRGEIDMTSVDDLNLLEQLVGSGKFSVLAQSGMMAEGGKAIADPMFGDAPVFTDMIRDKLTNETAHRAFDYWSSLSMIAQWVALPPATPEAIAAAYRKTHNGLIDDPEFKSNSNFRDLRPTSHTILAELIRRIDATPPDALAFVGGLLRKQGLHVKE
jgi:tripartite-type tricarboxylate transporter receptor subunit TctC